MDLFAGAVYLEKALDAATLRQQVISNNIANVNTQNFRPGTVAFEDQLKQALAAQSADDGSIEGVFQASLREADPGGMIAGAPGDISGVNPVIQREDGKVDINKQMVNQAKSQIMYAALSQKISGYFGSLKYVIDNSGR